jgi:hypothetical protein
MVKDLWFKLNQLHEDIGALYNNLTREEQKSFADNYSIDCGTDLADLLFKRVGLLDFFNGN